MCEPACDAEVTIARKGDARDNALYKNTLNRRGAIDDEDVELEILHPASFEEALGTWYPLLEG